MKISKKILVAGLSVLALGAFMSCDGEEKVTPVVADGFIIPFSGVDEVTKISGNLLDNGDADGAESTNDDVALSFSTEGATKSLAAGLGKSGNCWRIEQNVDGAWSNELQIELTTAYGQGKSYLITGWAKKDPSPKEGLTSASALNYSYAVYSGAVTEYCRSFPGGEYYDYDSEEIPALSTIVSPWGGAFSSSEVFSEALAAAGLFDEEEMLGNSGTITLGDDWKPFYLVIPSTAIEKIANDTGINVFSLSFYQGGKAEGGYSYLLDEVNIYDLSAEKKYWGKTYPLPTDEEPEEDEELEE